MAKNNNDLLQISTFLNQYVANVSKDVDKAAEETANDTCTLLKSTSPRRKGKYAKSWKVKKENGSYIVYNTNYQLTHLLEKGHDIVAYGKKRGRTKAQPHIGPARDKAETEFEKKIKEKVENEH